MFAFISLNKLDGAQLFRSHFYILTYTKKFLKGDMLPHQMTLWSTCCKTAVSLSVIAFHKALCKYSTCGGKTQHPVGHS